MPLPSVQALADRIAAGYRELHPHSHPIPLHEPLFTGHEKEYLNECIDSGFVSSVGAFVPRFEGELARYAGAAGAVAVVNGTAALHLALLGAGVRPGDRVLCPDLSFVATAAAITYAGAVPVFLEVERDTLGLSPAAVAEWLTAETEEHDGRTVLRSDGSPVSACLAMHNVGFPARLEPLRELCRDYRLALVEDAAEALGSRLDGRMCGSHGRVGVYSFNGNKIITSGGGGALISDDPALLERLRHLATTAKRPHPYRYDHDRIGYNYRMPNLNAALALAQLEQLPGFLERKRAQFEYLAPRIGGLELEILSPPAGEPNHWFLIARLHGVAMDTLIPALDRRGIMARPLWSPISRMEPYRHFPATANPVAVELADTVLCLPNGVVR